MTILEKLASNLGRRDERPNVALAEILVASVRSPIHILESAMMGADVATIPFSVMQQLCKHPLTEAGIAKFLEDWKKVPQ